MAEPIIIRRFDVRRPPAPGLYSTHQLLTPLGLTERPKPLSSVYLEGLPPQLDELEKIYLWGIQVYGAEPSAYQGATAGFGPDGDREGWQSFLSNARRVLDKSSATAIPGPAKTIRDNLFDLLPATQNAVALPLPSYSLKVVEGYVSFTRSQGDYGGD